MQARAEFNDWNNCWPVSGPDSNRLLLWTLGPATFQPSRWACVSTRLHAGARRPNSPHMWRLAGVIVLCGETHILWQLPNLPREADRSCALPISCVSTRLHAGARRPNSPHMWRLAGVIVLCGETHILWQLPNLPR